MTATIRAGPAPEQHGAAAIFWSSVMRWETPQAIELRFGMEITMYVANR
jgi:coenzyme PQQ precursor peptide PqqA